MLLSETFPPARQLIIVRTGTPMTFRRVREPIRKMPPSGSNLPPHYGSWIDLKPAFVATRLQHGYFALVAIGAFVCVQKHLAGFPKRCLAIRAGWVLKLEIPLFPAVRATVMRDDPNTLIDHIPLQRGVAPG